MVLSAAMPPAKLPPAPPVPPAGDALAVQKQAVRASLRARRAELAPGGAEARAAAAAVAAHVGADPRVQGARCIAVYAPSGTELDPAPIARAARARGAAVCYPRVVSKVPPVLTFHRHTPPGAPDGEAETAGLLRGALGLLEPPADPATEVAAAAEIDVFVVPGLGFGADGSRLGYGLGFYDAALRGQPSAYRIGVGFSFQKLAAVPSGAGDEPLDVIVTPDGPHETHARAASPAGRPAADGAAGASVPHKREVSP